MVLCGEETGDEAGKAGNVHEDPLIPRDCWVIAQQGVSGVQSSEIPSQSTIVFSCLRETAHAKDYIVV